MSRRIAPVQLGCCPVEPRCRLCADAPPWPDAARVEALREGLGATQVRFFGGPPPDDAQLEAAGDDVVVRVRPDLLSRADAARLLSAGVHTVELDALSFDDAALQDSGRAYKAARVETMLAGLREAGFQVGIVLAIGLPGSSHDTSIADAERTIGRADTARLHPVLVLRGSGLWEAHLDGRYTPLELGQAVTTSRAMLDVLEGAGVEVIRVGTQPGPDELGRAVAGPIHSGFRELVEALRTRDAIRDRMQAIGVRGRVDLRCAPADQTRTRGPLNDNVRALRAEFGLDELRIVADPSLARGQFELHTHIDESRDSS